MSLLQRFLQANRRLSARLDRRDDAALYARYDSHVERALRALSPRATVVDVGGGRTCSFAQLLPADHALTVVAVDVSSEELVANSTVDRVIVADVSRHVPFADGAVDLLVSRTLLEHVPDVQRAASEMARVLKPGAQTIHLLPCRHALFAIVARLVPFAVAKRILHLAIPESKGVVEFDVFYDRGHPPRTRAGIQRRGVPRRPRRMHMGSDALLPLAVSRLLGGARLSASCRPLSAASSRFLAIVHAVR